MLNNIIKHNAARAAAGFAALFAAAVITAAAGAQTPDAAYGYQREECPFESPPQVLVICGGITVPEDRKSQSGKVYLPVVRIMGANGGAQIPAAIFGGGGPGGGLYLHNDEGIAQWNDFRKQLLGDGGELILLDPRGSGESHPSLTCPNWTDAVWKTIHLPLDAKEESDYFNGLSLDCARWWNKRVRLSSYTTDETVDDMEAIRRVLGLRQWDIIGFSNGTKLALELIRKYPDGVRAAVLDSPTPADTDTLPPHKPLEVVLDRLGEDCARSAECKQYGDLRDNLDKATKRIADKTPPITVVFDDATLTLALTPSRFVEVVMLALYDEEMTKLLPRLARQLADGKWDSPAMSVFAENAMFNWLDYDFAWALFYATTCRENIFSDRGESDGYIFPGRIYPWSDMKRVMRQHCRRINDITGGSSSPIRPPLVSDKPMIIIGGRYDMATPAEHAQALARRLANAQLLTVPTGHTPLQKSQCIAEIAGLFLRSPNAPLSEHCAVPPLKFE